MTFVYVFILTISTAGHSFEMRHESVTYSQCVIARESAFKLTSSEVKGAGITNCFRYYKDI
jgi:hypothetical protein